MGYETTPCINLLQNVDTLMDAEGINAAGGHIGCYRSNFGLDETLGACVNVGSPNYNQDLSFESYTYLSVCYERIIV